MSGKVILFVWVFSAIGLPSVLAQSDVIQVKTTDGSTPQPRLAITSSSGTNKARVRIDEAILRVSSTAPGTNVAAGDLRMDAGVLKYYDGSTWQGFVMSGGYVELGPLVDQTYTGTNPLIRLDETGAGTPNLLEFETNIKDILVVANSGQLRLVAGTLYTRPADPDTTFLGVGAGREAATGTDNTAIGYQAMTSVTGGWINLAVGYRALYSLTTGGATTAIGYEAFKNRNQQGNAFGVRAGFNSTTGGGVVAFGYEALYTTSTGSNLVAIGSWALKNSTNTNNTAVGHEADAFQQTGQYNTAIGSRAGYRNGVLGSKSSCIFVGYQAGYNETGSNKLYIANSSTTTPLIYGDFSSDYVRIYGSLEVEIASTNVAVFDRTTDDGTIVSIRQAGSEEGTIVVAADTISYNGFTGSHLGWTDEEVERGWLLTMTGQNRALHGSPGGEPVYGLEVTARANDPAVLGAFLSLKDPGQPSGPSNPHLVMAVGNGELLVVDTGRPVEPGDLLVSSEVPGCAMVDPGSYEIAHVVARAAEKIDWSQVRPGPDGIRSRKISVLFDRFDLRHGRHRKLEQLQQEVATRERRIEALRRRLDRALEKRRAGR